MVLTVDKKNKIYDGENKFKPLFDFLNVYSETFFRVGEDKTKASETTKKDKPWLNEKLPELNKDSANEICFKVDGIICVILVNKDKPAEEQIQMLSNIQNWLSPKINRGVKYKFGWINSSLQTNFMQSIEFPNETATGLILVNPGKRKRYYVLENDLNEDNISIFF